jgi:hypothetical protein
MYEFKMGKAHIKAAPWTIRTTKQLERGQFLRRQNWSEETARGSEYVEGTRVRRGKKKDVGEKRTRDGAIRVVNVGGRKALFNSKTPSHATTPLKEGKGKSLPTPVCRIRIPMVLFLHGDRNMHGLTANMAPRPAAQPFCSYLGYPLLCTREKDT